MRRITARLACACTAVVMLLPSAAVAAEDEREAIDALNDVRRANGVPELRVSESLGRSSGRFAERMLRLDVFAHGPSIDVAGRFRTAGETIAWHSGWNPEPRRTVGRWMASPGHRGVLLSPAFRWVGIGLARGKLGSQVATAWVAHVGSR